MSIIIVISGVSGAGKSSLARRINEEFEIPFYELDRLFNLVKIPIQNANITTEDDQKSLQKDLATTVSSEFLSFLVGFKVSAIVEGSWISIDAAKALIEANRSLIPLFLGFQGSGRDRLKKFQQGTTHWTVGKELPAHEKRRIEQFFEKQILKSINLQNECRKYGFKYIDTTEEVGFEEAFQFLKSAIEKAT